MGSVGMGKQCGAGASVSRKRCVHPHAQRLSQPRSTRAVGSWCGGNLAGALGRVCGLGGEERSRGAESREGARGGRGGREGEKQHLSSAEAGVLERLERGPCLSALEAPYPTSVPGIA
eukprot:3425651-Rhodomonas_salina.2